MHAASKFPDENSLIARLALWLATGLGVGFVAPAPGTIGGLWGLALVPAIEKIPQLWLQAAVVAVLLLIAVGVCEVAARVLGGATDPQPIVLDEIVVLPMVSLAGPQLTWPMLLVGFLLFRLFDIWKPGLAREAEKLPGGWGIVADDAVAAALAWATLHLLLWLDCTAGVCWLAPSA
jgi:phosphatidylglycerophosphatase A